MTLEARLKRLKMTQSDLARAAGVTPPCINQYLRGTVGISGQVAARIAEATGTVARATTERGRFEFDEVPA